MAGIFELKQTMSEEKLMTKILDELAQAQQAWQDGREGRARVNARRAVGLAVRISKKAGVQNGFGKNAVTDLRRLVMDENNPHHVRLLAMKLVARENDPVARTQDPHGDALQLIRWLLPDFPT